MPIYNFLEYSDNYTESSGSLWQFKRNEQNMTNSRDLVDVSIIHHFLHTNQVF